MDTIPVIVENGLVRPLAPLGVPDLTTVSIVVPKSHDSEPTPLGSNSPELYEILSRRYNTGETDLAARVDELDP